MKDYTSLTIEELRAEVRHTRDIELDGKDIDSAIIPELIECLTKHEVNLCTKSTEAALEAEHLKSLYDLDGSIRKAVVNNLFYTKKAAADYVLRAWETHYQAKHARELETAASQQGSLWKSIELNITQSLHTATRLGVPHDKPSFGLQAAIGGAGSGVNAAYYVIFAEDAYDRAQACYTYLKQRVGTKYSGFLLELASNPQSSG